MELQIPTSKEIPTQKEIEKVKEKKPRKKTLPVKYNQMLVFGYWMLGNMKSEELISNDVFGSMMRKLHMFDGTELQIEFLDNFMHQFPEINKQWKKDVLPKEQKERKQASKETKEKKRPGRPRKEKKIVTVESMDIIAELVAEAQREETATSSEMEIDEESEEEEEEEIIVQKFIFRDVLYLIDDKNTIYDFTEHSEIGTWNEEKKCIDFFKNKKTN
jgi:hypothetical protein